MNGQGQLPWDAVQLFLAVAETGSVSGGARRLRVGQPTVSRRLAQLEHDVGFLLFERRSDGVRLTVAGERLMAPARRMADYAAEVTRAAQAAEVEPHGVVRVAAPPGIAFEFLAPFAVWLRDRHPRLRLEVLADIAYADLARGEADLALRQRAADRDELTTVATVRIQNAVCVAPSLLARLPPAPTFADLPWLAWARPYEHLPPNPQLREVIPNFVPAFTSDNFLVLLRAAEAGVGAMVLARPMHRTGQPDALVALDLPLGPFAEGEVHLVAAKSALGVGRVALVARLMAAELQRRVDAAQG